MSSRFTPKFTIATAYPMMYASSDLTYIEADMLNLISTETASRPKSPSDSLDQPCGDAIEPSTDLYAWKKNNESRQRRTLRQLERLWQQGSEM